MKSKSKNENELRARRKKIILRRWRGFFRLFLIVLFFIASIWGLNFLYNSSYFKVKNIQVEGNSHYLDGQIEEEVKDIIGANIFEVDKKIVEERLTGKLVWLREAEMKKIFPDKIKISVIERIPLVRILCKDRIYLVGSEGVVLEEVTGKSNGKYNKFVLVKNVIDYYPEPGEKIGIKNALSCGKIYAILDVEIKEVIREAYIDNGYGDIIFLTTGGKKIVFGSSKDMVQKTKVFKEIYKQLLEEELIYSIIDLRNYENPVVK